MSARDVIEIMKRLPEAERNQVIHYFENSRETATSGPRYASVEQVKTVAKRVFEVNGELFRKLAQ